ncbi:hypothetical protein DXG01_011819, partial [Tephrocybe rancida]
MDSTWKTNAAGYELYGIVGEANGQALPLAFAFTASMDDTAAPGAKDRMLQGVLKHIHFAHTDKDKSEINAIHAVLPHAKSQLCSWHAIRYLKERLAEDKLPTKYDPRRAHKLFAFIDPTWAPGVSAPGIEDGVHEDDLDMEATQDSAPSQPPSTQPPSSTCRPPVLVIVHDGARIPHPEIPFNDDNFTQLTAEEIHIGAVKEMYTYCFEHELQLAWAYLWNRWYTPNQWKLWARSADDAISHLKTTMIVESLWKNVKHRDLKDFNRPRLDLVTYIVLTSVLSRVKLTLASVLALRRSGRAVALAGWQEDLKKDWLDFSRTDEHRMTEKELHYLKAPKNTKGRSERLAQIAEEETRPRGKYLTDLQRW